jgi:hypothetical protein
MKLPSNLEKSEKYPSAENFLHQYYLYVYIFVDYARKRPDESRLKFIAIRHKIITIKKWDYFLH